MFQTRDIWIQLLFCLWSGYLVGFFCKTELKPSSRWYWYGVGICNCLQLVIDGIDQEWLIYGCPDRKECLAKTWPVFVVFCGPRLALTSGAAETHIISSRHSLIVHFLWGFGPRPALTALAVSHVKASGPHRAHVTHAKKQNLAQFMKFVTHTTHVAFSGTIIEP